MRIQADQRKPPTDLCVHGDQPVEPQTERDERVGRRPPGAPDRSPRPSPGSGEGYGSGSSCSSQ